MKKRMAWILAGMVTVGIAVGIWNFLPARQRSARPAPLRVALNLVGDAGKVDMDLLRTFTERTGIPVEVVTTPPNVADTLVRYVQYLGSRSPALDVLEIDIIWTTVLADYLLDLSSAVEEDRLDFFPKLLENNTVDRRLVAIPRFGDVSLMYYRKDLLARYGFTSAPATWGELETMARAIQQGERAAGNTDFWGYLWPGAKDEGLTCSGLEWQMSEGGGRIIEEDGTISLDNFRARQAVERARKWIGTITPPEALDWGNAESRIRFRAGGGAFLRGWTHVWSTLQTTGSAVAGKVGVTLMPAGEKGSVTVLGGGQLGVSRYSRQPEAAIRLAKWLTSPEALRRRAVEAGLPPARISVVEELRRSGEMPTLQAVQRALDTLVARPSRVVGDRYGVVSTIYFTGIHGVLSGRESATGAFDRMQRQLRDALQ